MQQYVQHRLAVARGAPQSQLPGASELEREVTAWGIAKPTLTFTPEAIEIIAQLSAGLPRVINIVCDRALEIAHRPAHADHRRQGHPDRCISRRSHGRIGAETASTRSALPRTDAHPGRSGQILESRCRRSHRTQPTRLDERVEERVPVAFGPSPRPSSRGRRGSGSGLASRCSCSVPWPCGSACAG